MFKGFAFLPSDGSKTSVHSSQRTGFAGKYLALTLTLGLMVGCQWNMQSPATPTSVQTATSSSLQNIDTTDSANAEATAQRLFSSFRQWRLEQNPILASALAETPLQHWPDLSLAADEARTRWLNTLSDHLKNIDIKALTPTTALHIRALNLRIEAIQAQQDCQSVTAPFGRTSDWHHQITNTLRYHQPVHTIDDFYRYLVRLEASSELLRQWQGRIDQAGKLGALPPIANRQKLTEELDTWLQGFPFSDSAEPTELWKDIQHKIAALKLYPKSQAFLEQKAKGVLTNSLLPVLRQLKSSVAYNTSNGQEMSETNRQLRQQCYSESLALMGAEMPVIEAVPPTSPTTDKGQKTTSENAVAKYLNQQAIRRIQELENQLSSLLQLDAGEAFAPQLRAWMASHQPLPANPLQDARERLASLNQRLPEQFAILPATSLVVTGSSDQYGYRPAIPALNKPAFFYVPIQSTPTSVTNHQSNQNPLTHWPSVLYQQSLPGKHLQTALAMENPHLPQFLSMPEESIFTPGWPLFSAELATRIGGYRTNAEQAGVLIGELNAQLNLMLDTATHGLSWSDEQLQQACVSHSPLDADACTTRLNNIQTNAGLHAEEAVSLIQLRALIADARQKAGDQFNEPVFYSSLLAEGAIPAELYQDWLSIWIKTN